MMRATNQLVLRPLFKSVGCGSLVAVGGAAALHKGLNVGALASIPAVLVPSIFASVYGAADGLAGGIHRLLIKEELLAKVIPDDVIESQLMGTDMSTEEQVEHLSMLLQDYLLRPVFIPAALHRVWRFAISRVVPMDELEELPGAVLAHLRKQRDQLNPAASPLNLSRANEDVAGRALASQFLATTEWLERGQQTLADIRLVRDIRQQLDSDSHVKHSAMLATRSLFNVLANMYVGHQLDNVRSWMRWRAYPVVAFALMAGGGITGSVVLYGS